MRRVSEGNSFEIPLAMLTFHACVFSHRYLSRLRNLMHIQTGRSWYLLSSKISFQKGWNKETYHIIPECTTISCTRSLRDDKRIDMVQDMSHVRPDENLQRVGGVVLPERCRKGIREASSLRLLLKWIGWFSTSR